MCVKHEELAAIGITMRDKKYHSAIIKALLEEMSKFASSLLTATHVLSFSHFIDPEVLINHVSKKADHLAAWCKHDGNSSGKRKGKQIGLQDEVMAATQGNDRKKRQKGKCHNCGKPGH